jgi:hypothetical protein
VACDRAAFNAGLCGAAAPGFSQDTSSASFGDPRAAASLSEVIVCINHIYITL